MTLINTERKRVVGVDLVRGLCSNVRVF